MIQKDTRVDAYIKKAAPFAQTILKHIRRLVHEAEPEISETIKWGFPHFDYQGTVCSMAAFKHHCAIVFRKGTIMKDPYQLFKKGNEAMGQMGQIKSLNDLPSDRILREYIQEAIGLNKTGIKLPSKVASEKKELEIPGYLIEALKSDQKALVTFQNFSYSNKKDYVEWITEAKAESTRNKRVETALEWLAEGKIRNWKYVRK